MSDPSHVERIWDFIEKVGVGMLTTRFAGGLRARPMEARPDRSEGAIFFVTDVRSAKDDELAVTPHACLIFVDPNAKTYLSITGRARIVDDPAKIEEIWRATDKAWWPDGPEDPNARLLRFEPQTAELWDGPRSAALTAYEFAKAWATGQKPDLGENRKVMVDM